MVLSLNKGISTVDSIPPFEYECLCDCAAQIASGSGKYDDLRRDRPESGANTAPEIEGFGHLCPEGVVTECDWVAIYRSPYLPVPVDHCGCGGLP